MTNFTLYFVYLLTHLYHTLLTRRHCGTHGRFEFGPDFVDALGKVSKWEILAMSSAPWPGFPNIVKTVKLRWYTLELCLGLVLLAHFVLIVFRELTVCVFLAVGVCRHSALYHRWRGGAHPHHWISNVDGDKQLQHQRTIVKGKTPTRRGYGLPEMVIVPSHVFFLASYVAMSKLTVDDKRSAMAAAVSGCCMYPNSHDGCRPE